MASRRIARFCAGAMEHAGLGEAAYFLRKAKSFISHAQVSLEGTDPLGHIKNGNAKIDSIIEQIGEALRELEASERALVLNKEEEDEKSAEEDDKHVQQNRHTRFD